MVSICIHGPFSFPDSGTLTSCALADSDEINDVRDRVSWNAEPWWLYNITSAPNTELENRESAVIIASVTGGGSALNGMQCVRGTTDDYDRWGSFFGGSSTWSWDGILPYFKKAIHPFDTE